MSSPQATEARSLLAEVVKTLAMASLTFLAGFLAFLVSATPQPQADWSVLVGITGLSLCGAFSVSAIFWMSIVLIKGKDVLGDGIVLFLVIFALLGFAGGLIGGVVTVATWL